MERVKGIEPSSGAWEASALPLSYTRHRQIYTKDLLALQAPPLQEGINSIGFIHI